MVLIPDEQQKLETAAQKKEMAIKEQKQLETSHKMVKNELEISIFFLA